LEEVPPARWISQPPSELRKKRERRRKKRRSGKELEQQRFEKPPEDGLEVAPAFIFPAKMASTPLRDCAWCG